MTKTFVAITPEKNCKIENVKVEIIETEEKKTNTSLATINLEIEERNKELLNLQKRIDDVNQIKEILEQDKISIQTEVDKIIIPGI